MESSTAFSILVIFFLSLIWLYIASKLWTRGRLKAEEEHTQISKEEVDVKEEKEQKEV